MYYKNQEKLNSITIGRERAEIIRQQEALVDKLVNFVYVEHNVKWNENQAELYLLTFLRKETVAILEGALEGDPIILPKDQGTKSEYLIPAYTVETPPAEYEVGFAQALQNGEWVKVADDRGEDVYDCTTGEKVGYVNNLFDGVQEGQTILIPEAGYIWQDGKWVAPPPPTAEELARQAILKEIARLEAEAAQPRRIREAILGTDNGWLAAQEALIATERAKL